MKSLDKLTLPQATEMHGVVFTGQIWADMEGSMTSEVSTYLLFDNIHGCSVKVKLNLICINSNCDVAASVSR